MDRNNKYKYIIGTGWWCPLDQSEDGRRKLFGSNKIRSKYFHKVWYGSISKYTNPDKIMIVDSASPVLPDINASDSRIEIISLTENPGHSTNHLGKYCGCMRAMILGMEYALMCDADYFVYVEQDAVLKGTGIIEYCIGKMVTPYMFGNGAGTPQLIQQSLFIIRKDGIRRFLNRLHKIPLRDYDLCPEDKFFIASSKLNLTLLLLFFKRFRSNTKYRVKPRYIRFLNFIKNYDELPIGYGRKRPIGFKDEFFYMQHASDNELQKYLDN